MSRRQTRKLKGPAERRRSANVLMRAYLISQFLIALLLRYMQSNALVTTLVARSLRSLAAPQLCVGILTLAFVATASSALHKLVTVLVCV